MKLIFCDNSLRELLHFRGNVIKHFIDAGHEVILVAPANAGTRVYRGCRLITVKLERGGMNPMNDLSFFLRLLKIYRKERPDFVFHYTIKPNVYGSMAARLAGVPSSAMVSGLGYAFYHDDIRSRMARLMLKISLRCSTKVIVLNEGNMNHLIEKGYALKDKVILLKGGEGIDLKKYS